MSRHRSPPSSDGRRVVVCDYTPRRGLQSIAELLRRAGYRVFQADDGLAIEELCELVPDIELLVVNTNGTGLDTSELIGHLLSVAPRLRVVHIGSGVIAGLQHEVATLSEGFTSDQLLRTVAALFSDEVCLSSRPTSTRGWLSREAGRA